MNKNACLTVLLVATTTCTWQPSRSQEIGVHVDATAGLDPATRQLVAQFVPQQIRDQAVGFLNDALPLIRTNIDLAMDRIYGDFDKGLLVAQCAAIGTVAETKRQIDHPFSYSPGPIIEFRKEEGKRLSALHQSTNPKVYADTYSDLDYQASVMYCQMRPTNVTANVEMIEATQRWHMNIWLRVLGQCSNPEDCVTKLRQDTLFRIRTANWQDDALVRPSNKLSRIKLPSATGLFSSYDRESYEEAMRSMLRIQDELVLAQINRQIAASQLFVDSFKLIDQAKSEVAQAQTILTAKSVFPCSHQVTQAQVDSAKSHLGAARKYLSQSDDLRWKAVKLDLPHHQHEESDYHQQLVELNPQIDAADGVPAGTTGPDPGCTLHSN